MASRIFMSAVVIGSCMMACAEETVPSFATPREAGFAWQLQGEYDGELNDEKWGAHVIAEPDGTFRAIGFKGGLPGDGWRGDFGQYVSGTRTGETVTMKAESFYLTVDGKTLQLFRNAGTQFGTLRKRTRRSETLGAKPPEGAEVLFDGTSTAAWKNAKLTKDRLLAASNCSTKQVFGDHHLHIEFRVPFMPESTGQARGNSGVYVQSRYEIQVLDSFGLTPEDNGCGGIYKVSKPVVNMSFPPLVWQTYDIDFTAAKWDEDRKVKNARISVRHNGVVIHDDVELPRQTPGRWPEGPEDAPLFLQNHGNSVVYRNIWVLRK